MLRLRIPQDILPGRLFCVQLGVIDDGFYELEACFFDHTSGSGVVLKVVDQQKIQSLLPEQPVNDRPNGFGHQSLPPVILGQRIADLPSLQLRQLGIILLPIGLDAQ